jgi:hypothetical protein
MDRDQKIMVCALRQYGRGNRGRAWGTFESGCFPRRAVRRLAMAKSTVSPSELNTAESALIKKGLLKRHSTNGDQCLILRESAKMIPCSGILRKRYSKVRRKRRK